MKGTALSTIKMYNGTKWPLLAIIGVLPIIVWALGFRLGYDENLRQNFARKDAQKAANARQAQLAFDAYTSVPHEVVRVPIHWTNQLGVLLGENAHAGALLYQQPSEGTIFQMLTAQVWRFNKSVNPDFRNSDGPSALPKSGLVYIPKKIATKEAIKKYPTITVRRHVPTESTNAGRG